MCECPERTDVFFRPCLFYPHLRLPISENVGLLESPRVLFPFPSSLERDHSAARVAFQSLNVFFFPLSGPPPPFFPTRFKPLDHGCAVKTCQSFCLFLTPGCVLFSRLLPVFPSESFLHITPASQLSFSTSTFLPLPRFASSGRCLPGGFCHPLLLLRPPDFPTNEQFIRFFYFLNISPTSKAFLLPASRITPRQALVNMPLPVFLRLIPFSCRRRLSPLPCPTFPLVSPRSPPPGMEFPPIPHSFLPTFSSAGA